MANPLLLSSLHSENRSDDWPHTVELSSSTTTSRDGHFTLRWREPTTFQPLAVGYRFRLEEQIAHEAPSADNTGEQAATWHTLYHGNDRATTISGRPDGHTTFRVTLEDVDAEPLARSAELIVEVRHHSLTAALALFTLGAAIFTAMILIIWLKFPRPGRVGEEE